MSKFCHEIQNGVITHLFDDYSIFINTYLIQLGGASGCGKWKLGIQIVESGYQVVIKFESGNESVKFVKIGKLITNNHRC